MPGSWALTELRAIELRIVQKLFEHYPICHRYNNAFQIKPTQQINLIPRLFFSDLARYYNVKSKISAISKIFSKKADSNNFM